MSPNRWLMKAEPGSRIVKGKDVKFSVDDFESLGRTAWEGVRNHEAKNLMKAMEVGDKILFYHSNCKNPGIVGFAEVCKEAYPDYTAWDTEHPYFDSKSNPSKPRWFMVDLSFTSRAKHLVPLSLIKRIASGPDAPDESFGYIGEEGVRAIKSMQLVNRGRLSVQSVDEGAWTAIALLAEMGGWEETGPTKSRVSAKGKGEGQARDREPGVDSDAGTDGEVPAKQAGTRGRPNKRKLDTALADSHSSAGGTGRKWRSLNRSAGERNTRESVVDDRDAGGDVDGDGSSDLPDLSDDEESRPVKRVRTPAERTRTRASKTKTRTTDANGDVDVDANIDEDRKAKYASKARRKIKTRTDVDSAHVYTAAASVADDSRRRRSTRK